MGVESKEKQRWLSRVKILQKLRKSDKIVQKEILPTNYTLLFSAAMEDLIYKGCKYIILGCTELPLIFFSQLPSS